MNLNAIRKKIDEIDLKILNILDERMRLSIQTRDFKTNIEDREREKELKRNYKNFKSELLSSNFKEKILSEIIKESKRVQKEEKF